MDKLIERLLSYCQELEAYRREQYRHDLEDAAEEISKIPGLRAENEALRARNTKLEDTVRSQRNGLQELREEIARVTAERDAAIADMVFIARTYPVELCDDLVCKFCVHFPNAKTGCPGWEKNECFEWRGIKKED